MSRFLFVSICFDLFCDVEVSRFLFVSICVLRVGDVMLRCPVSICLHLFRFAGCLSFISSHEVLRCPGFYFVDPVACDVEVFRFLCFLFVSICLVRIVDVMLRCPGLYLFLFVSHCFGVCHWCGVEVSRVLFVSICFELLVACRWCDVEVYRVAICF